MTELTTAGNRSDRIRSSCKPSRTTSVLWLQGVTAFWMLIECGVALFSAVRAQSPALLAFGSDSLVELLSAAVVLLQYVPRFRISEDRAARAAAVLLFALAAIVTFIAALSIMARLQPRESALGIALTSVALLIMPVLSWLKRREARRLNNRALAADAVQSGTCAYLAAITLSGLAVNAMFHISWFDTVAAVLAVPLLITEGKNAWRGQNCGCCQQF